MFGRRRSTQRAPRARSWEQEDARRLALELAGLRPAVPLDPMVFGLVLQPGETAYRAADVWLSQRGPSGWPAPVPCQAVATDQRLIVRMPPGELASLWWGSLVGFHPDLSRSSMVLDYGDGFPRQVSGPQVPAVAVIAVAAVYGVRGLAEHAALEPLRGTLS